MFSFSSISERSFIKIENRVGPTHHILKYLKENLENKLNGMVRILGKHGEFNRVEFGNALWTSVIRPCIAHGCSIIRPFLYIITK
jgi:hypothetical protein